MKVTVDSELIQERLQPCSCTSAAIPVSKQFYEKEVQQKPGSKYDVHNVILLLELLVNVYADWLMGIKVTIGLCMGGNDFVPKLQQVSHSTLLKHVLKHSNSLLMFENDTTTFNKDCIVDLYCPKKFDPGTLSFDQVRA